MSTVAVLDVFAAWFIV